MSQFLWLTFILLGCSSAEQEIIWDPQDWTPISIFDFWKGSFVQSSRSGYIPQAFATAESNDRNRVVYASPFGLSFGSNPMPHTTRYLSHLYAKPDNIHSGTRYVNPNYAPKYVPYYNKNNGNQQYKSPKHFPKVHNKIVHPYKPISPQQLHSYRPYDNIALNLHGYNKDPIYQKLKQDVNNNAKRLKEKEKPPKLHKATKGGKIEAEEEARLKFSKNEQNENFQPAYEPHTPLEAPYYYDAYKKAIPFGAISGKLIYPHKNSQHIKYNPIAYFPLKNQIKNLQKNHANKFSEGGNDYPETKTIYDGGEETSDGYDIFEKQKSNFDQKKANFQGNFDSFTRENHPDAAPLKKLKKNHNHDHDCDSESEEEFVPVKTYAQVRHTESVKHLPRQSAYDEAVTYDDVVNAPRLKEAVKTTKSQTVYTEEGYEDNAYDHAGHLKHASNHQGHGGFVKGNHAASGKYKDQGGDKYEDGGRTRHGHDNVKLKKWQLDEGESEEYDDHKSYSSKEGEHESNEKGDLIEAGSEETGVKKLTTPKKKLKKMKAKATKYVMTANTEKTTVKDSDDGVIVNTKTKHVTINDEPDSSSDKKKYVRHKKKKPKDKKEKKKKNNSKDDDDKLQSFKNETSEELNEKHEGKSKRSKRESDFLSSFLDVEKTFLSSPDIQGISKEKVKTVKPKPDLRFLKYPYYYKRDISKNSPLKYAENLATVPIKTPGGSEFYDSRSHITCADVESDVDPVPDRIKNKTPESEEAETENADREKRHVVMRKRRDNFDPSKQQQRLKGLGDKIDCFKEKYFGDNPLDSPFFDEDVINPPEPINFPFLFKKSPKNVITSDSSILKPVVIKNKNEKLEKIPYNPTKTSELEGVSVHIPKVMLKKYSSAESTEDHVYSDVISNINANLSNDEIKPSTMKSSILIKLTDTVEPTKIYQSTNDRENIRSPEKQVRIVRDNHFVYEPYKIIEQSVRSKKTPTIAPSLRSPLVKKMKRVHYVAQASTTVETKMDINGQPVKRFANNKVYVNIGRTQRKTFGEAVRTSNTEDPKIASIEDILNADERDLTEANDNDELKYETNKESVYKNHKRFHIPVTLKTSIRPEELDVEYLLKAKEDEEYPIAESKSEDEHVIEKLLIDDLASKVIQSNNTNTDYIRKNPNRNIKIKPSPSIFDVSAYIPKPIPINAFLPRHNLSSKYASDTVPLTADAAVQSKSVLVDVDEDVKDESDVEKPKYYTEPIRHTVEYNTYSTEPSYLIEIPSTTERLIRTTTPYNKIIRTKPTEVPTNILKPQRPKKRRRIKLASTTSTTAPEVVSYYDEPINRRVLRTRTDSYRSPQRKSQNIRTTTEEPYSVPLRLDTTEYTSNSEEGITSTEAVSNTDYTDIDDVIDKAKMIEQWQKVLYTESTSEKTTTPPYEEVVVTQPSRRLRKPVNIKRDEFDPSENYERVSRKPRILEKTSKKRKTTVITNSKRYDGPTSSEIQLEPKVVKTSTTERNIVKQTTEKPSVKDIDAEDDNEELEIKETSRLILPKDYEEIAIGEKIGGKNTDKTVETKSAKLIQTPSKEESRYEEDVEEEEKIVEERPSPPVYVGKPYEFYRDPNLAKKVNRLSDNKKANQYTVHSDVEVFKSDFEMNKGPKHGGNYKKMPSAKLKLKRVDELELDDLKGESEDKKSLHGGNYRKVRDDNSDSVEDGGISARVLNSFASLIPITENPEPKPLFEKNPGKRLYYFVNE